MNIKLSKDEFHELLMLYVVQLARESRDSLNEEEVVYTPEFDEFLRHIISKPLGGLKTVYYREDAKTKLHYKRMAQNLREKDEVRLII